MTGLTVNDTIADSELSVTGKTVSDLQSGVKFGANAITGTLKYIENWTWFDSDPEINTGNFLVFKSTLSGADKITAQLIGAKVNPGPIELDSDGIAIFHVTNKDTQMVQVVAYKGDLVQTKLYTLNGLTCETE